MDLVLLNLLLLRMCLKLWITTEGKLESAELTSFCLVDVL